MAGVPLERRLGQEWTKNPDSCRYCQSALGFGNFCASCNQIPVISCPSGHGLMNTAWIELRGTAVEIDQCPTCGGLWIDAHERTHLQDGAPRQSVNIDEFLRDQKPKRRSRARYAESDSHDVHDFIMEINHQIGRYGPSNRMAVGLPTPRAAWLMLIVTGGLFVIVRFFLWPYILAFLE